LRSSEIHQTVSEIARGSAVRRAAQMACSSRQMVVRGGGPDGQVVVIEGHDGRSPRHRTVGRQESGGLDRCARRTQVDSRLLAEPVSGTNLMIGGRWINHPAARGSMIRVLDPVPRGK
jgi:hypothetical protein